jgi:iron(III) transport system substrate-binding protein
MRRISFVFALLVAGFALAQPPPPAPGEVVVYSGRNVALVGPLLEQFEKQTGIGVKVRYGETPGLAALILEEGKRSPADVYLAQDAGALGLLEREKRLQPLPEETLARVSRPDFRSAKGTWVALSGRMRVLAYDTRKVKPEALPSTVDGLTASRWKGKIGWAPTNASFQAFVTAYRVAKGDEAAREWLRAMKANAPRAYKNNTAIIEALARGEVQVGLVNHYYLHAMSQDRKEPLPVANHALAAGDPGALVNVAGVGILDTAKNAAAARRLVEFLLGPEAQAHFSTVTFEYPVVESVPAHPSLPPLGKAGAGVDLSRLEDLRGTVDLLQQEGVL